MPGTRGMTCKANGWGGCSGAGTVAGVPGARCMKSAREGAVALLRPGDQAAGVPATAAPISPAAAITAAGKATSPQNTDAHLPSRDFGSGR